MTENEKAVRYPVAKVVAFLLGEGELEGCAFGEVPADKTRYWWRKHLRAALQSQVSNTDGWVTELSDEACDSLVAKTMDKIAEKNGVHALDLQTDISAHSSLRRSIVRTAFELGKLSAAHKAPQQVSNTPQDGTFTNDDAIRKSFEAHFKKKWNTTISPEWNGNAYFSDMWECAWQGYQAALSVGTAQPMLYMAVNLHNNKYYATSRSKAEAELYLAQSGLKNDGKDAAVIALYDHAQELWPCPKDAPAIIAELESELHHARIEIERLKATPPQQQEQSGEAVARMVHDFPALSEFFAKYALGPMTAPSCLCCGRTTKVEDYAVRHAELPGIIICRACKSATETSATPTATASQVEELSRIEAMVAMLEEGEWAEHVGGTYPIASRLEAAITQLHNELRGEE